MITPQYSKAQPFCLQSLLGNLTSEDYRKLFHERNLFDLDLINKMLARLTADEATLVLGFMAKSGGLMFVSPDGTVQFKPDVPWEIEDSNGKKTTPKYFSAKGEYGAILPTRVSEGEAHIWIALDRLKREATQIDGKPYVVLTEGGFKAIIGCQSGILTLGFLGVWMGMTPGTDKKTGKKLKRELIPILKYLANAGINFIIAFDADCATNKNVVKAQRELAKALIMTGADVRIATGLWSISEGKGMDDYIQGNGTGKFKELLLSAKTLEAWERQFEEPEIGTGKRKIMPADEMALLMAEDWKDKLAFNDEISQWMRYEAEQPGIWSAQSDNYIESIISKTLDSKSIKGYGSNSYVVNIVKKLRHLLILSKWDEKSRREFIPYKNCVLEIATKAIHPHSPGFKFTSCLPRDYNPLANNWDAISNWMNEATGGNENIKQILLCFCNAVIKGRSDIQKFLHITGHGGTGKGTFMRLLVSLIGENNVCSSTLSDWCGNQFESANGYGKRLIAFWDEDKFSGKVGKFKSLTGGDYIRGEIKGKTAFQYVYGGMVALCSNFPVFVNEASSGLSRRVLPVAFTATPKRVDPKLHEKFQAELDAFTNYVLSIDDDTVTEVLNGTVKQREVEWQSLNERVNTDSVFWWLNEFVVRDSLSKAQVGNDKNEYRKQNDDYKFVKTLFGSYYQRCLDAGKNPKSNTEFSRHLLDLTNNILGWSEITKKEERSGNFIIGLDLRKPLPNNDSGGYRGFRES